jgi:hypothetical protein
VLVCAAVTSPAATKAASDVVAAAMIEQRDDMPVGVLPAS